MSKIISKANNINPYSNYVKTNNGIVYYVDSCNTLDCGLETMVFPAAKIGNTFKVVDWGERYLERYDDVDEMVKRHFYICNHLEELLDKEESDEHNTEIRTE